MRRVLVASGWLALFGALVILTAFAAMQVDRALTVRMEALKADALGALERMAGRSISYGQISPSFFRSLNVRDLVIHDSRDASRTLLTIHEVRVYYSLFQLLLGREPTTAIREIRLLNSQFNVDTERDSDVVELVKRLLQSGSGEGLQAKVTGANIGVTVVSRDSSIDLRHVFFQVEAQSQAIAVNLRGDVGAELRGGFSFTSSLKAQGSLDRSLTGSDMTIRLVSFASSLVNTSAQTLQLVWNGSSVDIRKIQDRSPVALDLQGDLDTRVFTLHFQSQDLRPDRLFAFSRPLAQYANWLKTPITSTGHVTYHARTGKLEYQADASAYLEDQLPVHGVTLTTSVRGSETEAFFEPLRLSSVDGTAEFAGSIVFDTLYPSGLLSLVDVDTGSGQKVNASLSIDRLKGHLSVHGNHLQIGELGFDSFQLSLSPSPGGAAYTLSTSFAGSPMEDLLQATGEVHLGRTIAQAVRGGTSGSGPSPVLTLAATLKNVPPAKLYHLLVGAGKLSLEQRDVFNLLTHYSVSTEAVLTTDLTHLSLAAHSVTITSNDDPATAFQFGISVDKSHLSLTSFNGSWKGVGIQGGFEGDLGAGGQIGFASNIILMGTSYFLTGRYSKTTGLSATGSFGLAVSAIPIRGGGALLKLKGERFPLPVRGKPLPASFDISGLVTPDGEWSVDFRSITIYDLPLPKAPHTDIQLSGRLTPRSLEITRMALTDATTTLNGSAHADLVLPGDVFDPHFLDILSLQGSASLRTADGLETYAANGGLAKGQVSLVVQADGVPVQRFGVNAIQGTVSGTGSLGGPVEGPFADVSLSLKQGKLGSDPLELAGRLVTRPDGFDVSSISAAYLAHKLTGGEGSFDFKKRTFAFKGQFQTEVFADTVGATVGLEGSYARAGGVPLAVRVFDLGLQGRLSLSGIRVNSTNAPAWAVSFRTTAGRISFDGGPGNSIHGWIDPQLAFWAALQDPLPITGSLQGRIVQDRIHATFNADGIDLLILNSILKSPLLDMGSGPTPAVHFTAGVASGRLVVDGEVNDPDMTGQLDIVGGGIRTAYSPEEAGPIRTSLVFTGKEFHIPRTFATAGNARLSAEASFTIDHWIPLAWDISIATESQSAVRMKARFGILNADGSASGTLRVSGDDRKTTIGGSLVVSDCRITLGKAEIGKFVPEESPTFANVTIQTGRRVEFQWPSKDVPVVRTTASPGGTIAVTYRGDTGAYTVKGGTGVQGGEIYYFDRSFIMKKGSITFNENQTTFDPWITAHAEAREWDQASGVEVRVFLDADSPFSKFSPRFSSDPPRAEADILAMIGAPIKNRAEAQGIGMAALVYTDILSQNWILRPFEQKVRQALNLDMFSIRTQIIQNLVAQKVLGTTVNPLDNTSVSLGKYLGNDLFLEMLVRLQQPQIPVAVITPGGGLIAASTELQPDFEVSLEWATPLFLLDWSFLPKHPETMFLSDNSLSFSWRITY